jgi:hypothetical protein
MHADIIEAVGRRLPRRLVRKARCRAEPRRSRLGTDIKRPVAPASPQGSQRIPARPDAALEATFPSEVYWRFPADIMAAATSRRAAFDQRRRRFVHVGAVGAEE